MHPYLFELASLMAIFAFAIVSPGADLAMVMRQSLVHGRREAIITSIGVGSSLMFHVTYTILGLGLIISQSIYLFNIVKWCGVAYLLYIGVKSLRAGKSDMTAQPRVEAGDHKRQSISKSFFLGFAANALNPKPVFFFLSIFSTVVSIHTPIAVKFGYGLVMATCLITWFVGVSIFMTTPKMRAAFSRASQWIDRISGAVFIVLGLKLATEKAS
ncbi:LysE family translocator [Agrobacterium vitis]|uniref:LysE family translocator n=1 Tax=Agrobacterium vitis TaxID=373 RepID=A0ABD6GCL2_AGRVI|nr:LysE family translocator [Agrobacterium vitis]MUO79565.1 LysE family translocator [Agrobacterium vitis]MUO95912.1 LysE family translocator [Agrobacterium vitis]MUP06692.1 LysE family translocator [Agrobacterium vitis]MUZ83493.1 LysE family translocator [Agrobacterium vitis]MVA12015.1 LysE family translocator [Agrobacterium vitis]